MAAFKDVHLYYFDARVLGEPIRMIFKYAGIPFEDHRVQFEEWPELKKTLGWGKMPLVKFNGKELSQSSAIGRYFAQKFGLTGSDDWEAAKCDEYVEVAKDFRQEWRLYNFEPDPSKKEEFRVKFLQHACPFYLAKFEEIVKNNGGKFLVGSKETWADFFLVTFLELFEYTLDKDLLSNYPNLQALKSSIFSIPAIKEWVAVRPIGRY